ncbi:hypothetical protein BSKO_08897 [Bryopsis sp. KO-2023]|nr:hypothetical protein BSKO_08897 [Bryopsis sp. KO-2023]
MRSPEEVYQEWSKRRNGILRALTTDVNKLYELCDPSRENLCLYGLDDSSWTVDLPVDDVPPELPEPAMGINYARDGMKKKDWLAMIAAHSDSWLLAVAFFKAACFTKGQRNRLFTMINEQPTLFELVQKGVHDDNGVNRFTWPRGIEEYERSRKKESRFHPEEDHYDLPSGETVSDGDWKDGDGDPCPMCSRRYRQGEFWIACDLCDTWFCGRCAKMTQAKAERAPRWECTKCSHGV